jgi:prepilin-type N-terminal cleavage/methylation domain-containing protein
MKRLLRDESGFTLVELTVAAAIMLVVVGALSNVFVSGLRAGTTSNARLTAQQNVHAALDKLEYEARCARSATVLSGGAGVHLDIPAWCAHASGDVSWCVDGTALVRAAATDCTGTTQGFVDNVSSATPFCLQTVTGARPELVVSLTVSPDGTAGDSSSATDEIAMRNADYATATSAACP